MAVAVPSRLLRAVSRLPGHHVDLPGLRGQDPGLDLARIWLGLWFLYQLIEGSFGLFNAQANGGGVAFFAHVGGFVFGALVTRLLVRAGQATPQAGDAGSPLP